ncbi:type II toxin-antitoxin system PemK/MazF family toxin [Deinococcus sp.]|uniref:type II toxin-antitoxin system PemK/MazF family toxin n=1 Tax=Deinococcus sp. TaxID=47478 RepID=UPI0025E973F5|nr:type II toxin-antitoxin system PemK/MazF family toxin [Deinococcus sp.]
MIQRGEIWWADLGEVLGSRPAGVRPVLVIQANSFNQTRLNTVIVAILTKNLFRGEAPGNVVLEPVQSGLEQPSVVNVSQLYSLNKTDLRDKVRLLSRDAMLRVTDGLKLILDLDS